MSKCIKRITIAFLSTCFCVATLADVTNFVAACDVEGRIYVADWVSASDRFDNFRLVGTLHNNVGEVANVRGIAVGDFNGDGFDDIAVARRIYQNRGAVHILFNDGANRFTIGRAIDFPWNVNDWIMDGCAGDFNNDGIDDFTFNGDNSYLHIWRVMATGHSKHRCHTLI